MDCRFAPVVPAVPVVEAVAADSEGRGWYPVIKGLTKAMEVWFWMQVFLMIAGLVAGGAGLWLCWKAMKYTAWMFGL